jgi:starch phosphorylase
MMRASDSVHVGTEGSVNVEPPVTTMLPMPREAGSSHNPASTRVAYFSMEIALEPEIPTYSGGLGVLAGDMLRSAADLEILMVGVSLVHHKGYFRQRLDSEGTQREEPEPWRPDQRLEPMAPRASVQIEGRTVSIRAWRYWIRGIPGYAVPVYLLDSALPENDAWDQTLTDELYGGDAHYRLCQEVVLGLGGAKMLRELGYRNITSYHMNEGHAALLAVGLLEQDLGEANLHAATESDIDKVRRRCVFTTHTPVPAGQDQFPRDLMRQVLGEERSSVLEVTHCCPEHVLNMTFLALRFSHYINGVAMHHGEVSRGMFPQYPIRAITNGVHAVSWTAPAFQELFDRHVPEWRYDNLYLRYAIGIPLEEIRAAHLIAKRRLLQEIGSPQGIQLSESTLTIGFARRAAAYKRADLLFSDPERLRSIAHRIGPLQILFAGKAHPRDEAGKAIIRHVVTAAAALNSDTVRIVYLENYEVALARLITSGVDLWLNTPQRPQEASGTSGMKAALNGVPSLSVPDGWWIEGCLEGVTGWSIGQDDDIPHDPAEEWASLYHKLESIVVPMYYARPSAYAEVMRSAISVNGSFFNTHRMLDQYVNNAYFPREPGPV